MAKLLVVSFFLLSAFSCSAVESPPSVQRHPETIGDFHEGDIVLRENDAEIEFNGIVNENYKWPKTVQFVVVPYQISSAFSSAQASLIRTALFSLEQYSCIRFVNQTNEADFINFVSTPNGCYSYVGRVGGAQGISIMISNGFGGTCLTKGTIMHETLHALGFYHMQSSQDRDGYVDILFENIESGKENNFKANPTNRYNTTYDFESIMHYGAFYFSKNGEPTITPKKESIPLNAMGQRKFLTTGDILRLSRSYNCWK